MNVWRNKLELFIACIVFIQDMILFIQDLISNEAGERTSVLYFSLDHRHQIEKQQRCKHLFKVSFYLLYQV